jgi:hypothetical protein
MNDLLAAQAAVAKIAKVLSDFTIGWDHAEARRCVRDALGEVRRFASKIAGAEEVMGSLWHWTEILYSPKRHARYGHPERVRHFVRMVCPSRLRMVLARAPKTWAAATDSR